MAVSLFDCQYPENLRRKEAELIEARRGKANAPSDPEPPAPYIGLAFSGGGIRSATFCLGVLQALAKPKAVDPAKKRIQLRDIDLLSTVSGGSYIGAFLGALFCRDKNPKTPGPKVEDVERDLRNSDSTAVHWLRENGRYLAPNGAGDLWLDVATILRNWAAVMLVISVMALTVLMLGQLMDFGIRLLPQLSTVPPVMWLLPLKPLVRTSLSMQWQGIYWSPFLVLAAAVVIFLAVPCGWAYWLGRLPFRKSEYVWVWGTTVAVTLAPVFAAGWLNSGWWYLLTALGVETLVLALLLSFFGDGASDGATSSRRFRNIASRAFTVTIILAAMILGIAVVDTIGRTAYMAAVWIHRIALPASFVSAIGVLLSAVRRLTTYLASNDQKKHVTIPLGVIGSLAGFAAAVLLFGALSTASYVIARPLPAKPLPCEHVDATPTVSLSTSSHIVVGIDRPCTLPAVPPPVSRTPAAALVLVVLTILFGRSLPFVNLSSLTQFYSARLSRTYIGASNEIRQRDGKTTTEEVAGDDLELKQYTPHVAGGPLHLINVTLNETVGGRSQVLDRDRKGLSMAIGPAGFSIGVAQHAVWKDDAKTDIEAAPDPPEVNAKYHIWPPDRKITPKPLSLSQWTGISGAAVSTGLGAQTNLGLSLLCGLANVRLGYWWDSQADPGAQGGTKPTRFQRAYARALPVQSALTDEFLAQFRGPHRRYWYLTDGGHFENTATYELLRRRVPIIVVCDDGEDSDYSFADLANLVRKARIDFDADVRFLKPESAEDVLGALDDLKPQLPFIDRPDSPERKELTFDIGMKLSRHHLLFATVTYPDDRQLGPAFLPPKAGTGQARSLMIVVKPSLTGNEPLDLLQYAAANPSFPQQTTADQFFDEAQWESYRKLGEHIGGIVAHLDLNEVRNLVGRVDRV